MAKQKNGKQKTNTFKSIKTGLINLNIKAPVYMSVFLGKMQKFSYVLDVHLHEYGVCISRKRNDTKTV